MVSFAGCSVKPAKRSRVEPPPLMNDFKTRDLKGQGHGEIAESIYSEELIGTLTLRKALSLALMKNPELSAFSWEIRAREAQQLQTSLLPNPELEAEMEGFGGQGQREGSKAAETTILLSQLFEVAGKRSKRTRVADLDRELAEWDYESKRLDVLARVTQTFVDLLAAQEHVTLDEELVRISEEILSVVSQRVKAGKISPLEETKAEVILARAKMQRGQSQAILKAVRKRLSLSWGSPWANFNRAEGDLMTVHPLPNQEALVSALDKNPDLARWCAEIESHQATVNLEKANRFPDPSLSGGIQYFNETDDSAFVVGLSIPLPLFDRNQGNVLKAQSRLAKAEEERRDAYLQVQMLLAEAYQGLSAAHLEVISIREAILPGAKGAFEAAFEGYRLGKFSYLEVLDAQRTLFEARHQYIDSLARYHKAVADVERLVGRRLGALQAIKRVPKEEDHEK